MSIAQIGGATSPKIVYGKNNTGATLSVGDIVQAHVVDGAGDGYQWVTPDLDLTKPESLHALRGVVWAPEGATSTSWLNGDHIAVLLEGYAAQVGVDANSPNIALGDSLIYADSSLQLVAGTNNDWTVDAVTAAALTDSSGGTASQTVAAISGSGADAGVNNNFASLTDEINKLRADVLALRDNVLALVDDKKVVAVAMGAATTDNTTIAAYVKQP